jgi:hypothetical protein
VFALLAIQLSDVRTTGLTDPAAHVSATLIPDFGRVFVGMPVDIEK